jgi:hypothetical protein
LAGWFAGTMFFLDRFGNHQIAQKKPLAPVLQYFSS